MFEFRICHYVINKSCVFTNIYIPFMNSSCVSEKIISSIGFNLRLKIKRKLVFCNASFFYTGRTTGRQALIFA